MQIADNQNVLIQIVNIKDALGNPTKLTETPTWTSSDEAILKLTVSADGLSATGVATGVGTVTVTAGANGITASAAVDVVAGLPVSFALQVSILPPAV